MPIKGLTQMFQFFRRARNDEIIAGGLARYLRHALGETALVVVGILIALQIDNWNDFRIDREQEREYLASMVADLREDIHGIDQAVSGNKLLISGIEDLLALLQEPGSDNNYRRKVFVSSIVYTYWYLRVDFSELTMTQLKSSGDLQLIESPDVRQAMLRYEQGIESSRHQYEEIALYFHVFEASQKQLLNYRLAKKSFEYIEGDYLRILEPLTKFEPLVPEGEYFLSNDPVLVEHYYSDMLFYMTTLNNTVEFLTKQKEVAEDLIRLIRSEYGIET